MRKFLPYNIEEIDESNYQFLTEANVVYDVRFEFNNKYLPDLSEGCPKCKDIIELILDRSHKVKGNDKRIGATIFEILNWKLSDSCNGVMYKCFDGDNLGCARDRLFQSWQDEFGDDEKIDIWVNDFSEGNGVVGKMYLLVDKGCINHQQVVHNFTNECKPCRQFKEDCEFC